MATMRAKTCRNVTLVRRLRVAAEALGICKIEAGANAGRVLFNPEPDIEPMAIIKLMQETNGAYHMDGPETLRFKGDMGESEARIACVANLVEQLAEK